MANGVRRAWRCGCVLAGMVSAACGGSLPEPVPGLPVASAPQPETQPVAPLPPAADLFTIDATVGGGMHPGGVWSAEVHLGADGTAQVAFEYLLYSRSRGWKPVRATHRIVLDVADVRALREAIDRSGFFGRWPDGEDRSDLDTWQVIVRSGSRSGMRTIYGQDEFQETEELLRAVIDSAVAGYALDAGRTDILRELPGLSRAEDPQHGRIVAALKETALHGTVSESRADAVLALSRALDAGEFEALLDAALERAGAGEGDAILAALVDRQAIAAPLFRPEVVLPRALKVLETSWRGWGAPPKERAKLLRDCASAMVVCHEARAVPLFERMVVELSTPDRPLVLPALAAMGDAAIDSLARLLDSPRVELRIAAARMCEGLASELTSPSACGRPPGANPDLAMKPFRERLVPKLRQAADDQAADPRLRAAASEALVSIRDRPSPPGWKWHRLDWN